MTVRPLCPLAHGPHPYWQCAHGHSQLADGAEDRRAVHAALRRYGYGALENRNMRKSIAADLDWLGIKPTRVECQSKRLDDTNEVAEKLKAVRPPLPLL